ncbi:MAG: hypothetical protein E4H09_00070, partial [Spirochaetales bacterium]
MTSASRGAQESHARAASLLVCLFWLLPGLGAQEIVIGGQMSAGVGVTGSLLAPQEWEPGVDLAFSPLVTVYGAAGDLRAQYTVAIRHPDDIVSGSLDEAVLTLYPSDTVMVGIGRVTPTAGASLLFSPVNYLAGLSLDSLGATLPSLDGKATRLAVTYASGDLALSAAVAPVPDGSALLAADGFSIDGLPYLTTVTDSAIPGAPLTRATVQSADSLRLPALQRISVTASAGWSGGWSDVTAYVYYGLYRVPLLVGEISTAGADPGEYALAVRADESAVTAVGASMQAVAGDLMFWGDASFAFDRTLGTTSLLADPDIATTWHTESVTAPALDMVVGTAAYLPFGNARVALEYRHGFFFANLTDVVRLDLPGTLLATAQSTLADGVIVL